MCDIAGIASKKGGLDVYEGVKASLELMRHRGPDDWEIQQWEKCCLGGVPFINY